MREFIVPFTDDGKKIDYTHGKPNELVRCRDCKYRNSCRQTVVITAVEKEERYRLHMEDKPLTFCSYGESARTDRGKQCD